jgi:hypothetical protein
MARPDVRTVSVCQARVSIETVGRGTDRESGNQPISTQLHDDRPGRIASKASQAVSVANEMRLHRREMDA